MGNPALSQEGSTLTALVSLLSRYGGTVNAERAEDIVARITKRAILPHEIMGTARLLARVLEAEAEVDRARSALADAERDLADHVGTKPAGKDAGFNADFEARQQIVAAVIEAVAEADLRTARLNGRSGGGDSQ